MDDVSIYLLSGLLALLIGMAAFFSGSETAMMAVNRYRLRHRANDGHRGAVLTARLLEHPDRLLGLILFCNNIINFYAASLGVVIAVRLMGNLGYALGPVLLTFVFLVFAEAAPKTVAAFYPERVAFPASYALKPLAALCHPFVWTINRLANSLLSLFRLKLDIGEQASLTREELRTALVEAGVRLPARHKNMLLSILDLEQVTVADIMVPRSEISGLDINDDLVDNLNYLRHSSHTRVPLYRENLDDLVGVLHTRRVSQRVNDPDALSPADLEALAEEPCFVPIGASLNHQLLDFQRNKRRLGFVVDEYGTIQGLVTLEDILEEIVGEFTTDIQAYSMDIAKQDDGSFIIDGGATIRELNRQLAWPLPNNSPKTLNGLILEQLEAIPEVGATIKAAGFTIEITQVTDNAVKSARVSRIEPASGDT